MSKTKQVEKLPDFDWDKASDKGFGTGYSAADRTRFEEMYETTISPVQEKEVVKGVVVGITDHEVILNICFKSDGIVSSNEFRDLPGLKIGDEVEVYVENQEDTQGQLVLSRKKAKVITAWDNIQKSFDEDVVIDANVKRRTKGGLIVDIFGIEAFLPGSQIDVKPIRDFDIFVGRRMEVKVVKINYANDNVVVSHKILIEKDLEAQRRQILNNLEKGQVLEGVIKNITSFGVFIDLGGVDGLLHITDISWGRINHPSDLLALDQKLNVVVLDFDEEKKRISLGLKQLQSHPWDSLSEDIQVGSKVTGRIVNVADYGAFLEIKPGVEGLIHVSEMSWSQHLRNPQEFMNVNDEINAVVLTLDRQERKMSLGIKQLTEDPWTQGSLKDKYAIGTRHKGVVRNLTNFGLFIELEEGIDGLVHVSDLSWTKKIKHPSDFVKVNDELEVVVLELDAENRRLALGHKQLEEDSWDIFENIFAVGSVHSSTIVAKGDKYATLELPYGVEGIAAVKNLTKRDGTVGEVGENLDFIVLEFFKEEKKIVLTHSPVRMPAAPKADEKGNKFSQPATEEAITSEKMTFGDLSVLSALKEQFEHTERKEKAEARRDSAYLREYERESTPGSEESKTHTDENTEVFPEYKATASIESQLQTLYKKFEISVGVEPDLNRPPQDIVNDYAFEIVLYAPSDFDIIGNEQFEKTARVNFNLRESKKEHPKNVFELVPLSAGNFELKLDYYYQNQWLNEITIDITVQ